MDTKSCVLLGLVCVGGAFSGSIVGDNVTTTATVITQDLDLGNYPIDSGANAYRASEYVQCDNSVTALTNSASDTGGCDGPAACAGSSCRRLPSPSNSLCDPPDAPR